MTIARQFFPRLLAMVTFFALLWLGLWRQLSGEWSVNDQYSYGWFVPLFAVVLFWLRFEGRPAAETSCQLSVNGYPEEPEQVTRHKSQVTGQKQLGTAATTIIVLSLLLLLPLRLFEIGNPDWRPLNWLHALCVVTITLVFIWWIGGKPWLKHFVFPVAFTLVAVPWVTPVEEPIVQGLMRLVANIASEAAALFGIPTSVQGNLIRIPSGLLGVNEACSGVRSLQTSLMIGLLFGELKRLSVAKRITLIMVAAAIAFVGNCIRAFFLVWVAATRGAAVEKQWHDLAGYGIVVLVFVGTLALAAVLGKREQVGRRKEKGESPGREKGESRKAKVENPDQRTFYFPLPTSYFAFALIWLVLVEFGANAWYRSHERDLAEAKRWEVQWPQGAEGLHEIKIDDDVRRILRFDSGRAASWTLHEPNDDGGGVKAATCTVYFFRWNSGKNSALLANLHRPDVCLPAIGWKQNADSGVKNYPAAPDLVLPFRHFAFQHGSADQPNQQTAQTFYCLWEDRVPGGRDSDLPNMSNSSSAWTRAERVRVVLEGRRHLGQQVLEIVIASRGELDANAAEKTFEELMPRVVKRSEP